MAKMLQDINMGRNLRRLRKMRGLKQKDVCARMDIIGRPMLRSTYGHIEAG